MQYQDEKRRFVHNLIVEGLKMDEAKTKKGLNGVAAPEYLVDRWAKKFYSPPVKLGYPEEPRLVNRFMLGADPEFIFSNQRGDYTFAENEGLDTLSAFGCDMCGRIAELRAYPSRFAIDVVASLMDALRWLGWAHPRTLQLAWKAVPFYERDGCGGHLHFGRKRPNREEELTALDRITGLLIQSGVFDGELIKARLQHTDYGRNHDFRAQSHGYEYRTMPTWLGSPWQAYFTMVVSKLAVLHQFVPSNNSPGRQLINLVRAYRALDDDANICAQAIEKYGLPVANSQDFKKSWGVPIYDKDDAKAKYPDHFFPTVIEGSKESKLELFNYLTEGTAIPNRVPVPNWTPFALAGTDYNKVTVLPHYMGVPEVAQGLIAYKTYVQFSSTNIGSRIHIRHSMNLNKSAIKTRLTELLPEVTTTYELCEMSRDTRHQLVVALPNNLKGNVPLQTALRMLFSDTKLFPIVKVSKLTDTVFDEWKKEPVIEAKPTIGRLLDMEQQIEINMQQPQVPNFVNMHQVQLDYERRMQQLVQGQLQNQWGREQF